MRVLCIDHREGDGYIERREVGASQFSLYRRVQANPERFQVLCHNCNFLKRVERGEHACRTVIAVS